LEPAGGFGPRGVQLRAENDGDQVVLTGAKRHVRFARAADTFVVLARTGPSDTDIDLFLVDRDAPGISLTQQMTIASDTQYHVDGKCTVDGGRALVWEAAWSRDQGRADRLAPMAKLFACQTFRDVTAMAQQIFGGVGFTVEYDIQLYFRRAKALQIDWWDSRCLEELVAADVLDDGGETGEG